jgi:hypothetical protein
MNLRNLVNGAALLALCTIASAFVSESAHAQQLQLGYPGYGGNGCPQGSASVTLSPDSTSMSILFDSYQVATGGNGPRIDRKSCNLSIPVTVPGGYSVSIIQVDYRGFNSLPRQASSALSVEYFFAGSRGARTQKNFRGPLNENFETSDRLIASALTWSPCGAQTIMRVNTSMTQMGSPWGEDALSTVDSADISSGLVYHLQFRRCN